MASRRPAGSASVTDRAARSTVTRDVPSRQERGAVPDVVTEIGRMIRARLLLASFAPEADRVLGPAEDGLPGPADDLVDAIELGLDSALETGMGLGAGSRFLVVTFLLETSFGVQPVLLARPLRLH